MNKFMELAINEARVGIRNGHGGPFGCVVVKDNQVISKGHNQVLKNHDSTCHGEIDAIRKAEQILQTHDLKGCVIYTTGEPCAMCLAACKWANIEHVYYGCSIEDNSIIGFRDEEMDNMFGGRNNLKGYLEQIDHKECLELFNEYKSIKHIIY